MQSAINSPASLVSPPPPKTRGPSLPLISRTLTRAQSHHHHRSLHPLRLAVRSAVAIEKETTENGRPETFLRDFDGPHSFSSSSSVRVWFECMIRTTQDEVCFAIEAADGVGKFKEDVWSRPGGGGGISRVLQDGGIWEKAGVNVSVVYGMMTPEAYRAAKGEGNSNGQKAGPVLSSLLGSVRFKSRHVTSLIRVSILDSRSGVTIISSSSTVVKGVGLGEYFSMILMTMIKKCFLHS